MQIPQQIEAISIARAANAAHYEYLATVRKRTEEIQLDHELWRKAVEEFLEAYAKEDEAFKRYRASDHTAALQQADEERELNRPGLFIVANQLKAKNDEVRQLLDYFRKHAMSNPNANKGKKQDGDEPAQDDTVPVE